MKKVQKALVAALCLAIGTCALTACGGDDKPAGNEDGGKITVTFYDATGTNKPSEMTVLKTEKIDKGGTVSSYTPTKGDGYEFVNWFATPSKSHKFDFSEEINDNISIYGGFSKYVEDTRDYYIIGAGTSALLLDGWGVINDAHKFTKAPNKNEYTLTLDLKKDDEFTLNASVKYEGKRGAGYLTKYALEDGTEVFEGLGSVYDDSNKGSNIKVKYSGNYTLTLTTHPNEDYYNTNGNGYTEANKEIYNISPYDTIDWVRNGDVLQETVVTTEYFIQGEQITGWKPVYISDNKMIKGANGYSLEIYLKAGEEFMFITRNVTDGVATPGGKTLKADILTEASKAYVNGTAGNITAKAAGTYTFTYDDTAETLSVAFDATKVPARYDYYLDGSFGGNTWGAYQTAEDITPFKLVNTSGDEYKIENVTLAANEEFIIRYHDEGAALKKDDYGKGNYNFLNLVGGGANFVQPDKGTNIKVVTAGNYDITFNSYSKIIKIVPHVEGADVYDIYLKGTGVYNSADTASDWSHNFAAAWKMMLNEDETAYEFVIVVKETAEFGLELFNKGVASGNGQFLNTAALGSDGDANSLFGATGNFKCTTAGTYKVVYTLETSKIDIYTVQE